MKLDPSSAPSPAPNSSLLSYCKSSEEMTFDGDILIHGPPGDGKTFFAATASDYFSLAHTEMTELKDMLWIPFDKGATAGLAELNMWVKSVDVKTIIADFGVENGLLQIVEVAKAILAANPEIKYVVPDTISRMDTELVTYADERNPTNSKGETDTQAIFRKVLSLHKRFHSRMGFLKAKMIYISHSKAVFEREKGGDQQKTQRRAQAVNGGIANIELDITGQARALYSRDGSLILPLIATREPGKNGRITRKVYPQPTQGFEAKNRFAKSLKSEEEANLKEIFLTIQGKGARNAPGSIDRNA